MEQGEFQDQRHRRATRTEGQPSSKLVEDRSSKVNGSIPHCLYCKDKTIAAIQDS
jgi:hypothetical protein